MFTDSSRLLDIDPNSAIVRNPLVISPAATVRDAIAQMSGARATCNALKGATAFVDNVHMKARMTCVLVVDDDRAIGILTARDVVRLCAQKRPIEDLLVSDAMSHPAITLQESKFTHIFVAINLLRKHKIRHLPLLDKYNRVTGLLTHESLQQLARPVDLLKVRLVSEVMATEVICTGPDSTMLTIAQLMAQHRVSSVAIVEKHQIDSGEWLSIPVGILTERDLVQFRALDLDLETCPVQSVMSTPVFSASPEDSLWDVQQVMERRWIQRLLVTGARGELLGIATQTSLMQALNPLELYKLAEILERKVLQLEAEKIELLNNRAAKLEQQVKERTAELQSIAHRDLTVAAISEQMRSSLDLQDVLNTTVESLQATLNCDRVIIWQLQSSSHIRAIAEKTCDRATLLLGTQVYDPCFDPNWPDAYRRGQVQILEDSLSAEIGDYHLQLLEELQIRARVVIPILQGDTFWGLLEAAECIAPRQWSANEVALMENLADRLAIGIEQATSYQQVQIELIERRQTEVRLRESERRFSTLAESVPVGIFRTDVDGHCLYVNERWCSIAGLTEQQALGKGWRKGICPADRDSVTNEWYLAIRENRPFRLEYRFQRPDGTISWVFGQAVAEYNEQNEITGYLGSITDITSLKQAQEMIIHNSLHDPLTDLPNRALLTQRLQLAISRANYTKEFRYAVLFLDLDRFKVINDSLGHSIGDRVLKKIARTLEGHLRETDLVARLGGDEFVILLETISGAEEVIQIAERILEDCKTPIAIDKYELYTGMSIGVVMGTQNYQQASELMRDADIAMYRAKAKGKNTYRFFDTQMHTQALHRLTLETNLRRALNRNEYVLFYQPIFDIHSDRLIGFEALIRWHHPTLGYISPIDFISIAEEIGLIVSLDRWVFRSACQQLALWQANFPCASALTVNINLAAQDLVSPNFIDYIDQTISETGLQGNSICLEITERTLVENSDVTFNLLAQLKQRQIQIAIDDFGTGYSSLSYLHQLPADSLKIDRSFVSRMEPDNRNFQVASTIVTLGKQLGLSVVAEGIDARKQLQWLQELDCDRGQGFLFSKPLPAEEIEASFFGSTDRTNVKPTVVKHQQRIKTKTNLHT